MLDDTFQEKITFTPITTKTPSEPSIKIEQAFQEVQETSIQDKTVSVTYQMQYQ